MKARFTAGQRRAFVREWRRSGLSSKKFAEGRDFHPVTLCAWARAEPPSTRLVEVEVAPSEDADLAAAGWAWELKGPGGELRGGALDLDSLRVLVQGVVRGQR